MFLEPMSRSELHPDDSLPDLAHTLEEHLLSGFPPDLALDLVLNELVALVAEATRAGGAALALPRGETMVCRATTGQLAPGLGVTLDATHGLSGACLQTGQPQISADTELDSRVDHDASRRLGIRSILIVPVFRMRDEDRDNPNEAIHDEESATSDTESTNREVMGILEVFSNTPDAFPESAQKILQRFAEECARVRVAATELSWHKPAAGTNSDDFMPPPLPHSGYMWPDFAVDEPGSFDAAAFLGPESTNAEWTNQESTRPLSTTDEEDGTGAVAAAQPSDIHPPSTRERSESSPAFMHYLTPRRSSYEAWSLGLGGLALIAIVAVSFLIGSRIGWLRRTSSQFMSTTTTRADATGNNSNPCVDTTGPGCSTAGTAPVKSRRSSSPAKVVEKSTKTVAGARAKTADVPDTGDDLVVYEKGKVVFRMKPEPANTVASDRQPNQNGAQTLAKDATGGDANSVVEAASTTKISPSKSVWLSPQDAEARLLSRIEPKLPSDASAVRRAGTVVLEVQVAEDGTISSLRTISGDPILASVATDAVRNWRYQPYRLGNQPSQFHTDVTLNFNPPK
jgi:TonB family protein